MLGHNNAEKPHVSEGHWQMRAGGLLPQKLDHWWIVDSKTSTASLIAEIEKIMITLILPAVKEHMSDDFLKQQWLDGISAGITEFQRYVYLTTILKLSHDERLGIVTDEFTAYAKGKPIVSSAKEHIMMIS
jgi:hypothetical protein